MDKNWQKDLKIDARERGNELRFINDPRGLPGEVLPGLSPSFSSSLSPLPWKRLC